jgi:beta-glucosidase
MKTRHGFALTALCLTLAACSGGGGGGDGTDPECTTHLQCPAREYCEAESCIALPVDACRKDADCSGAETCVANACEAPAGDCSAPVAALAARQPVIEVAASSGKTAKTFEKRFPFPGNASQECTAQLSFKDLNGDGALQPYEDWTLSPAERAADLADRMTTAEKVAVLAHPVLTSDAQPVVTGIPPNTVAVPTATMNAQIDAGLRFGTSVQYAVTPRHRALWANAIQARCEASALGIPFVLSSQPTHSSGQGRTHSSGFSNWPNELSIGATRLPNHARQLGRFTSYEYRAVGLRMTLSPAANLATDPRWLGAQYSFGEDADAAGAMVEAFVEGAQGGWNQQTNVLLATDLGAGGVAAALGDFPGAGPAKDGWDARFAKGKLLSYPGNAFADHVAPFGRAVEKGAAAIVASYGIPETGPWTGLGVDGSTLEQVGASFNQKLLTDVLRGQLGFEGAVLAPPGVLDDAGVAPFGAPWGMETATKAARAAKAVNAGVDQFLGLTDTTAIFDAVTAGTITAARLDAAAARVLALSFQLGLFEDPYVDANAAAATIASSKGVSAGRQASADGIVVLVNNDKPSGWLDPYVNGEPTAGNAGNGTGKVLPAPPGIPYEAPGCNFYVAGDVNLNYVRSVYEGYGYLCNDMEQIKGQAADTEAKKMALCDYVFVRVKAPHVNDPDTGAWNYPAASLEHTDAELALVRAAREAISATAGSSAQLVVGVDGGRPAALGKLLELDPDAVVMTWAGQYPANPDADKMFLDVLFGIRAAARSAGAGKLPVSLPASDAAASTQLEDVAGDGAASTYVEGFGLDLKPFN